MNISLVLTLDTRYTRKDGSCAIILRLGRDNRTLPIPTGHNIPEQYWNEKKRQVRSNYDKAGAVARFNELLDEELKSAKRVLRELEETGQLDKMSLMDIKVRIVNRKSTSSFFDYADAVLADLKRAKKFGTHDSYTDAVHALESFHGSRNLDFKHVSFEFLTKFETHHYAKGNGTNGLAAYMRAIRSIYNKAIKSGKVDEKYYPFKKYTIRTAPTKKRAIDWAFLEKIILLELSPKDLLFDARNYFVSSYLMYGMNFYDMAFLTPAHIINGRINYRRSKTSKLYDIKISPALETIINHYLNTEDERKYIFPIIRREEEEMIARDIEWARKRYNKKLKDIAARCGIEQNLTSYVSRHSFATQAMLKDIPINAISSMLGHSSLKTTQIYLKSLPNNILDDYNALITS